MVQVQDGALVRQHDRPEVWEIDGGKRRWVPDPETLNTRGGWGAVQVLPLGQVIENPLGPMIPSVLQPFKWDDHSLIAAWPNPKVYVMEGGIRHWVTSPAVMQERGYDWAQIQPISSMEMNAIEEGEADYGDAALPEQIVVHTGRYFLGSGHYMETDASFVRATGVTSGGTTTETITWLGGYHGGVYAVLSDENGIPVPGGQSPLFRYGVDGTAIGRSKRFDSWSFAIDPAQTGAVRQLTIIECWAPDEFLAILGKWVAAGKSVAELAKDVGAVAAVITAIV